MIVNHASIHDLVHVAGWELHSLHDPFLGLDSPCKADVAQPFTTASDELDDLSVDR